MEGEMVASRIKALLEVLNIPLVDGWVDLNASPNLYEYWGGLELISQNTLRRILSGGGDLQTNSVIERYFRSLDAVCPPGLYRGEPVVDLGSGFGHLTFWLLLSGASRVHTIGDPERVGFVMRLADAAAARGLIGADAIAARAEFVHAGDLTLSHAITPGSVALVLLNDTLEHVNPKIRPWLFKASFSDLRTDGRLVCRQHNTSNPRTLARARELWNRMEDDHLLARRTDLLIRSAPRLTKADAQRIAFATRGYDKVDLEEALKSFKATGALPEHRPDAAAVNPDTGEPLEGRTDLPEIRREMQAVGFQVRAYPDMMASRRSRWLQGFARAWPTPFLRFHWFDEVSVFEAVKPGRP